jgi:hypothetical protein
MQQGLDKGKSSYRGRSLGLRVNPKEKSAEVIVLGATSHAKGRGGLTNKEGQNAKWFLIFNGMAQVIALKNEDRLTD